MDYYEISPEKLGEGAKLPLKVLGDSGEVFYELANTILSEIESANRENRVAVLILPVGPVGQYPILVRLINERALSLKNCYFINMDEYLDQQDHYIDKSSRLSFRGFMDRAFYGKIETSLLMPASQRVFPDPSCPERVTELVERLGGVDLAVGGIGINGHLAFNEPSDRLSPEAFAALTTRVLDISPETLCANSIGDLGGALERMPRRCVTVGMKEILSARKLRLAVFRDWHRGVCRRAAYGERTAQFPVTLAQTHPDALLYINGNAAQLPY